MLIGEIRGKVGVGIVAVRPDEREALLRRLPDGPGAVQGARGARTYEIRRAGDGLVAIAGGAEAAGLLDEIAPAWLLVVGVASGVPAEEPSLGDLVISTSVLDHEAHAVLEDGTHAYAPAGPMHPEAVVLAADLGVRREALAVLCSREAIGRDPPPVDLSLSSFYGTKKTKAEVQAILRRRFEGKARPPVVTTGALLASDRRLDAADLQQAWLSAPRRFRAVEAESAGAYRAASQRGVPVLSVRAVGEVIGSRRTPTWIAYAAEVAAAFTVGLLRVGVFPKREGSALPSRRSEAPPSRKPGDVLAEASRQARLGDAALERGEIDEAEERYGEALPLFREVGDVRGEASSMLRFGEIALRRSAIDEARRRYQEALPLFRKQKDALGEANCVARLGDLALKGEEIEEAKRRYQDALPLYRRAGDGLGEANCVLRLGDLALRRAEDAEARERFEEALGIYAKIPEPYSMGMTHRRLARLSDELDERGRHVAAARELWTRIGRKDLVAKLEAELGK
jgi:nucleoside phosphorylase